MMNFERTGCLNSRWDQADSEFVPTDSEWCLRFATQLSVHCPQIARDEALRTAFEVSGNDFQRARRPEAVADEMGRPVLRLLFD
jgi:hypothetical protein